VARCAFVPHLHCPTVEPGAVCAWSKLPSIAQHWIRYDLGVTAGSRDFFSKAK
jgi:hypothetical protein